MKGSPIRLPSIHLQVAYSPGRSPAVVLIHGGLGSRFNWRSQWEFLRSHGQEVLAYDLAGHGESGRYRRYSIGRHRRDLNRLLEHFKIQQPILCCHSYGVPIGLEWAKRHPTTALIAIGGGTHNLTPWWEIPLMRFLAAGGFHLYRSPQVQQWMQSMTSQHSTEAIVQFFADSPLPSEGHPYQVIESFWGYDGREHTLPCPVVVITGEQDSVFSPTMGAELATHMQQNAAHSYHLTVPNAGHLVMVEAPDMVNQTILKLLGHGQKEDRKIDEGKRQKRRGRRRKKFAGASKF
jgi:pimeloyl-ACP methyl ester carboxylesterase